MILFNDVETRDPIIKPDREERDFDLWILWADFKICLFFNGCGECSYNFCEYVCPIFVYVLVPHA